MKSEKRVVGEIRRVEKPLVFPLVAEEEGACVFEEAGDAPVSLRRKAQFFINHQLYARAMAILKLLEDLGARDVPLQLSLVGLEMAQGMLEQAEHRLQNLEVDSVYGQQELLCWAELERHRWGTEKAIAYLRRSDAAQEPLILERIRDLQVSIIR